MGNSYPSRFNANGVWKVNEISKNKVTDNTWPGLTGHRGVWGSGMTPGTTNVIDFVNIQTAGNATDFQLQVEQEDYFLVEIVLLLG